MTMLSGISRAVSLTAILPSLGNPRSATTMVALSIGVASVPRVVNGVTTTTTTTKVLGKEPQVERGSEEEEEGRGACRIRGRNNQCLVQYFQSAFDAWCQCLLSGSLVVDKSRGNLQRRRFFLNGWASFTMSDLVLLAAHSPFSSILIHASWEGYPGLHCQHSNFICF